MHKNIIISIEKICSILIIIYQVYYVTVILHVYSVLASSISYSPVGNSSLTIVHCSLSLATGGIRYFSGFNSRKLTYV